MSRYMGIIRQKQQQNGQKPNSHAKKINSRSTSRHARPCVAGHTTVRPSTMARACYHGQTVVGTVPPGLAASRTSRFSFLRTLIWNAESSCIELILQLYLIYMPQLHLAWIRITHFSQKLGLNHTNLQSILNKPKSSVIEENIHKSQINAN